MVFLWFSYGLPLNYQRVTPHDCQGNPPFFPAQSTPFFDPGCARVVRTHLHGELRCSATHEARRHVRGGALALGGGQGCWKWVIPYAYAHIYIYLFISIYLSISMHAYACICMYVCMYIYIIYIYIYYILK